MSDLFNKNEHNTPDENYWRSFKELHSDKEFIEATHKEFSEEQKNSFDLKELSHHSRRKFLALLGASAALAGAGCSDYRDKGEIIPYNDKPEEIIAGVPNYYASTCTACNSACGILIKTREGRPIKVDGNPDHPVSQGKTCAKGQASILSLYDPERIASPKLKSEFGFTDIAWKQADEKIIKALDFAGSNEIALISHKILSPTTKKLLNDFTVKYPTAKIYSYELFNEEIKNSAWKKCYGNGIYPLIKWNEAKIILSLEGDFLGTEKDKVETTIMYSEGRDVNVLDKFNRLYVVEGNLSLTGMNADYRFRLRPDAQFEFVLTLLKELSIHGISSGGLNLANYSLNTFAKKYSLNENKLKLLVKDLLANKGKSIIYAGSTLPEDVHIAVNYLNDLLGSKNLYRTDSTQNEIMPLSNNTELNDLVLKMKAGKVACLINLNSNPIYHLPEDLGFKEGLKNVPTVISLVESVNETSELSNFVLPINHDFESWGDFEVRNNFISLQQPVIAPLQNTRQKEAILLTWVGGDTNLYDDKIYHNYLMKRWEAEVYPQMNSVMSFKQFWFASLHDGVVKYKSSNLTISDFNTSILNEVNTTLRNLSAYVLTLKNSYATGDGRFANNGFLQELPHPVSKITWDNYAAVSEKTAKENGLGENDLVSISVDGRMLEIPVFVQPGCADNTISIELGYGRTAAGIVGTGVGFNANVLCSYKPNSSKIYSLGKIAKAAGTYELASTQEHHAFDNELTKDIEKKRKIIQEGTVELYSKNKKFLKKTNEHELESVYDPHPYPGLKWGMSIDLNKCTGCSECITACSVENNVPVVGKDQILKSREMMWLRIDRYYSGEINEPQVSNMPMLCQHCDQAPCENVCPVVATNHSPDGLNQMVYNRCVGTRYCSNNCPYKVRRFNFFNFRDHFRDGYQEGELLSLMFNPEVTVRSRGVMEKCTFCVQRISEARAEATRNGRTIKGSDVRTACQDACGTNAIQFGDINNKEEEFYKYRNHDLGYYVLEDLNVKPNVTYIARLRNTHTEEV
jgi:molybdopterin-containing oxidoreductase family iron-sulfur binding subunit